MTMQDDRMTGIYKTCSASVHLKWILVRVVEIWYVTVNYASANEKNIASDLLSSGDPVT